MKNKERIYPHINEKLYGIFAFNKNDPNDFLFFSDNCFSSDGPKWNRYGKIKVFSKGKTIPMFHGNTPKEQYISQMNYIKNKLYKTKHDQVISYSAWKRNNQNRIQFLYGRTPDEWAYMGAKQYLKAHCKVPEGYIGKVIRINSKHCPVKVELEYKKTKLALSDADKFYNKGYGWVYYTGKALD